MNTNISGMSPAGSAMFQMMVTKLNGDMRFVGIFNIIYGAILCLSIIGAIVGVPLIIGGIRLREAADSFEVYLRSSDFTALEKGLERQGRFFFILKVFLIVGLVITGLYILFMVFFFGTLSNLSSY
ncbi:MAG: DUF5362 domain-containing protein [candidate division KSB1 bacterium]|nr:DUF5362 domain-containing protein [candidate division KSB1 bacterium]